MANKIVVFTLNGCGHCVELKTKFKENHIPFQEIEIGSNQKLWDQVVNQTGHNSLPTVFVGLEGGESGPVFVPGRDYKDKDELLEMIKSYV
jgi:glutaredoxin